MKKPERIKLIKPEKEYCKKVAFGTKEAADYYLVKIKRNSKREKVPERSYLCYKCNCWHLTSWEAPDIELLFVQINSEIEELNKSIEKQYELDSGVMSQAVNELVQLRKDYKKLELENRVLKYSK